MKSYLSIFSFVDCTFGVNLRINFQIQGHEDLLEPILGVASAHGSWYLGKAPL